MSEDKLYAQLVSHYEQCFLTHGPVPKGVDWPNIKDAEKRYQVMLNICSTSLKPVSILDLGCGYGALFDYVKENVFRKVLYRGIDLSSKMIDYAIAKHGADFFECRDVLANPLAERSFDYVIMNGVFTEKRNLSHQDMEQFFLEFLTSAFRICKQGIAFNVMSAHVDWERDDLFHLRFDRLAHILVKHCSRHFRVIADYGLYEYTVYVYKNAVA